jgi:hypothetical protein
MVPVATVPAKLHRHAERALGHVRGRFCAFQRRQKSRARIPGHPRTGRRHVVAVARADRDRGHRKRSQLAQQRVEVRDDLAEHHLIEADEVHLVHCQDHLADAQQRGDRRVSPRLHQQALARIDQQHRDVRARCAGHHVACVLLVSWGVGEDEAATRCLEEAICDVDGDALIALGRQTIDQQCIVDAALHSAEAFAVPIQRRHHIIGDGAAFEQQPADQRGLAIIDRAAGQYAQQGVWHQK